jgi:hypothetical protein
LCEKKSKRKLRLPPRPTNTPKAETFSAHFLDLTQVKPLRQGHIVALHPYPAKAKSLREPLFNKEEKRGRKNRTAQRKEGGCNNKCDNFGLTKAFFQIWAAVFNGGFFFVFCSFFFFPSLGFF